MASLVSKIIVLVFAKMFFLCLGFDSRAYLGSIMFVRLFFVFNNSVTMKKKTRVLVILIHIMLSVSLHFFIPLLARVIGFCAVIYLISGFVVISVFAIGALMLVDL
jgi:hypothetical protein